MRNALAIAAKDMRIYLTTWTSYVLFAVFSLLTAFVFYQLVKEFQLQLLQFTQDKAGYALEHMNLTDWVMRDVLVTAAVFLLFLIPIVTMRLIAEERKAKTLELLMTAPIRPIEIVIGKYLAGLSMVVIMLGLTFVYPLLLHFVGESVEGSPLDWNTILVSYLGLLLLGGACVGLGLLTSSLTDSQIVAAVLAVFLLLILWFIGWGVRGEEGVVRELFGYMGLTTHLESFVRGAVRLSDVVYYLSLVFVSLFLSHRLVEAQRWR